MSLSRYKQYIEGAFYHVYNRGNSKQNIFLDEQDFRIYMNRLGVYIFKHKITLVCYCLMPNHVHLLIKQETSSPLFKFISSLHTSYSMYFNKKYNRVGHLFQGRFKQSQVTSDEYLLHLSRYIHINPVKDGLVEKPEDYQWSSFKEYISESKYNFCEKGLVLDYFSKNQSKSIKQYKEFVYSYVNRGEDKLTSDLTIERVP